MAEGWARTQRSKRQVGGVGGWLRQALRVGAIAAAGLLAACQTVVPRGPAGPPPPRYTPPPTRPSTDVDEGIPRDTARNRVALLVPMSGPNAGVGRSIANATQLALLDTRNEQVRITTYDTALGAGAAATRAIADGAQLILGPLLAEDVRQASPVARAAGVPVIAFSNDAGVAGNGTYIMGYTPQQSIERVVDYAKGRGLRNFGGLVPNALYGTRASTAFLRAVESAGGRVVSLQTYERSGAGVAAAVARMAKDAPFDGVLIADSAGAAGGAVTLLRRTSSNTRILGTELWNSDASAAGKPVLNGAWFASVSDALYRQYSAKYRARFAAGPHRLSSLGYDAVLLTVRIARDWPVGTKFPEGRLRAAEGFGGVDGAFRFGRDGVAERSLEVQELRGGTAVTVSPAPSGFGRR